MPPRSPIPSLLPLGSWITGLFHLLNKYLMNVSYVPDTVLRTEAE